MDYGRSYSVYYIGNEVADLWKLAEKFKLLG